MTDQIFSHSVNDAIAQRLSKNTARRKAIAKSLMQKYGVKKDTVNGKTGLYKSGYVPQKVLRYIWRHG